MTTNTGFNDIVPLAEQTQYNTETGQQSVSQRSITDQIVAAVKRGIFDTLAVGSGNYSFKTDASGSWWGSEQFSNAPAKINMQGQAVFTDIYLTGGVVNYGKISFTDSVNAGYYLSSAGFYLGSADDEEYFKFDLSTGILGFKGAVIADSEITNLQAGTDINIVNWQSTVIFSSSAYNSLTWLAGVISLPTGENFSIDAGSLSSISATNYIYFDKDTSTTALQTTATATTAVGKNKILLAVVNPNADTTSQATFQVFGGTGGFQAGSSQLVSNSVVANTIAANAISANHIQTSAVTADKIAALAITADKIGAGAVTSDKIFANAVTSGKIAAGSITSLEIAANTITAGNIVAGTITATEIANTTITGAKIASSTITGSKIAASTITGSNIAANTITATNLSVSTLSAISANLGTVTAGSISGISMSSSTITLARGGDAGSPTATGYLRWGDNNNKIWVDADQDMGLRANGGEFYFYCGSTQKFYIGASNITAGATLYVYGNIYNYSGNVLLSTGMYIGTSTSYPRIWVSSTSTAYWRGHLNISASATYNCGSSSYYWNYVNAVGFSSHSLTSFDSPVKMPDGRELSDIEALRAIKERPDTLHKNGRKLLDKRTFPVDLIMPAADSDGNVYKRDKNNDPLVPDENGKLVSRPDADAVDIVQMVSLMYGAMKKVFDKLDDTDKRLASLEKVK